MLAQINGRPQEYSLDTKKRLLRRRKAIVCLSVETVKRACVVAPTEDRCSGERLVAVDFATVAIVFGLVVFLPAALVGGLFVWAALKDGEEDRAVQKWLGIRRRTRLGR